MYTILTYREHGPTKPRKNGETLWPHINAEFLPAALVKAAFPQIHSSTTLFLTLLDQEPNEYLSAVYQYIVKNTKLHYNEDFCFDIIIR